MASEDWYGLIHEHIDEYRTLMGAGKIEDAEAIKRLLADYQCIENEDGTWQLPDLD